MKNQPIMKAASLLLPSLGALIIAATLYGYLYWQTSASTARAVLAEGVVATEKQSQSQTKDVELEYQTTAAGRARLPGLFVPAGNAVVFIEAVEAIGPASGASVTVSSIQADPMTGAAAGTIGTITAAVQAEGSWTAVMKTIVLAETLPYESSIDHLSLVREGQTPAVDESAAVWHLSFNMSASMLASAVATQP